MKNQIKTGILTSVLVFAFAFTQNANAQLLPEFGIKGGLNYATINNLDGTDYKPGLLLGAFLKLNVPASPVSIQPELLYVQYGGNNANSDQSMRFNYIQIPVLLKFGFGIPAAPAKPNVYFGPYMGFNTKAEFDDGNGNTSDIDDVIKDTDIGVVVGVGLDVSKLRLGIRYTAGLTSLYEDNFDDGEKNGAIALTVGIVF